MNKSVYILVGILILVVGSYFIFRSEKITNYPPKEGSIVAFGDSLVAGYGSTKGNDFVSLLSKGLGEEIINLGVSGDTTAGGLARIDSALNREPKITILLLGGNDFLRKVPREETFSNLRTIISKLQERGSIVVLVGVRGGLLSDSADGYYEDLAEETGSAYVEDVLDGLFGDARYMSDSIHPNDAGYLKIAERLYPVLRNLLP
jgi:lysophospholipase L1-like esterase